MNASPTSDAEAYDTWYDRHAAVFESEAEAVRVFLPQGEALEVGCGTGRFMKALGISQGLEPDSAMRAVALKRGCSVVDGVAEKLPFESNLYSCVLFITTLCFVANPITALAEAWRVLRPNQTIIIGLIDAGSPPGAARAEHLRSTYGGRLMTCTETEQLLANAGFTNITSVQTIFRPIAEVKTVESPERGCGRGMFAVLSGKKA